MLKGIDIAEHQSNLSLSLIKDEIDFVIIRAGYGSDYPEQDDSQFDSFVAQAESLCIPWGAYLYSYALTVNDAKSEVAHMRRVLKNRKPEMGVWFDMEDGDGYKARKGMPNNDVLVDMCSLFCDEMLADGQYAGIYANLNWLTTYLKADKLAKYDKWVAQWNDTCDYAEAHSIWQYTDSLKLKGYPGKLDANYLVHDFRDLSPTEDAPPPTNTKSRILQTGSNQITNPYGNGHGGIDIVKHTNQLDAIVAHSDGTVVWSQSGIPKDNGSSGNRSYGNAVKISHANGYFTLYAHMASIDAKTGDKVTKGQRIGYMGETGNAYGAHLHFEVRNADNVRLDPAPYVNADLPGLNTSTDAPNQEYTIGTYEVVTDVLTVRSGPSTSYPWKRFNELTANARAQIKAKCGYTPNGYAKGVICDVSEVNGEWGKTPSGWICLRYCNKYS